MVKYISLSDTRASVQEGLTLSVRAMILAYRYKDDFSVESASHNGAIGSVTNNLLHYWTGLGIVAKNLHSFRCQFDPHDIQIDEAIGFVRDDDQHHVLVEVDLRTLKKGIVARRGGWHKIHGLVRDASNEAMKALLISDDTLFLVESNEVIDWWCLDEIEMSRQSLRMSF